MDAPVGRVAAPGDQAFGVHGIEMVGEGGLPHPDRLGQLPLVGGASKLQVEQHQPNRQRTSCLGQRLIECAADDPSGTGQVKTDRWLDRWHVVSIPPSIDL